MSAVSVMFTAPLSPNSVSLSQCLCPGLINARTSPVLFLLARTASALPPRPPFLLPVFIIAPALILCVSMFGGLAYFASIAKMATPNKTAFPEFL